MALTFSPLNTQADDYWPTHIVESSDSLYLRGSPKKISIWDNYDPSKKPDKVMIFYKNGVVKYSINNQDSHEGSSCNTTLENKKISKVVCGKKSADGHFSGRTHKRFKEDHSGNTSIIYSTSSSYDGFIKKTYSPHVTIIEKKHNKIVHSTHFKGQNNQKAIKTILEINNDGTISKECTSEEEQSCDNSNNIIEFGPYGPIRASFFEKEIIYEYKDGLLIEKITHESALGVKNTEKVAFDNYKTDSCGNWTYRHLNHGRWTFIQRRSISYHQPCDNSSQ